MDFDVAHHCGLCTAVCSTYVVLGDERDSPRGRIYLIKDMLEQGKAASPEVQHHVDRCLSCLSCMTTCPGGVDYMHLVDFARAHIEETGARTWKEKRLRDLLAADLAGAPIRVADHCFGCTAGSGSSCGGALKG